MRSVYEQPQYFAVVPAKTRFPDEYIEAIERKGFVSRKQKANGIKFDRAIIKVKIHRDMRLWADVIYKNRFNNYLVLFDHEDNHLGVQRAKAGRTALRYELV